MEYRLTVTVYVFVTFLQYSQRWISSASGIYTGEYCNTQQFYPRCRDDGIVLMEHALYGRMRLGTCVTYDRGQLGCQANVLGIVHRKCSGRRECVIRIPDFDLENTHPCADMSNYLEASYSCLPVVSVSTSSCAVCEVMKVTEPSEGYIGSITTKETRCGSEGCPWLVEAGRGQQVSIRLLDFSYDDSLEDSDRHPTVCPVYAIIKEPATQKSTTVCGGRAREENVYLSSGNALELRVVDIAGQDKYFVLHYEFVGCTDPELVEGASVERKGDVVKYQCDISGDQWTLNCNGTVWTGPAPDCSAKVGVNKPVTSDSAPMKDLFNQPITSFSWEMALILLSIVTFGIVLCVAIVGVVCVKQSELKYRRAPVPTTEPEYALYDAAASRRIARAKYGEEDNTCTLAKDCKSTTRLYRGGDSTRGTIRTNGGPSRGYPYGGDGTRTTRLSEDTLLPKRFDPNTIESQRSHRYHNIPGELPPPRSPSPPSLPLLPQPPSVPSSTPSPPSPPPWIEEDPDV